MHTDTSKTPRSITAEFLTLPQCVWIDEIEQVVAKGPLPPVEVKIDAACITWFMTTQGGHLYFTSDKRFDVITLNEAREFTIDHAEPVKRHHLPSNKGEWFALKFSADTTLYIACSDSGIKLEIEPELDAELKE